MGLLRLEKSVIKPLKYATDYTNFTEKSNVWIENQRIYFCENLCNLWQDIFKGG